MLNYLNDDIKKDYIEWVKFIYDDYNDSVLDSILNNEKLFVAFVEDKINTDLYNYFKNSKNKITICNEDRYKKQFYYCKYYLNNISGKFNNGNYNYHISSTKFFDDIYYRIVDLIQDIPF